MIVIEHPRRVCSALEEEKLAPWSEPVVVMEVFLDGITVTRTEGGGARIVGWQNATDPDGNITERRVVCRCALPPWSLERLKDSLAVLWPRKEGH